MSGKGDSPRLVDRDAYKTGWDRVYASVPVCYYIRCSDCGRLVPTFETEQHDCLPFCKSCSVLRRQ